MTKLLTTVLACALLIPAAATAKDPISDTRVLFTPEIGRASCRERV